MRTATFVLALVAPLAAMAHGGEDHGAPPPPSATSGSEASRAESPGGLGELFEVLLKHDTATATVPVDLRVYVADARTNAPVESAVVALTFVGVGETQVKVEKPSGPGVYATAVTFPREGEYEAVAHVTHEGKVDLVTLGTVQVLPMTRGEVPQPGRNVPGAVWGVATIAVVAVVISLKMRARRRESQHG
jgi:hypothetical protein